MHRNLAAFARWFMAQPPTQWVVPQRPVYQLNLQGGDLRGVVIYREGRYQAELFIADRSGVFPEHTHPNVDSIEVLLGGNIEFFVRGRSMLRLVDKPRTQGVMIGVGAGVPHSAVIYEGGGAFISLQRWREGVRTTCVGLDWDGPPHHSFSGVA